MSKYLLHMTNIMTDKYLTSNVVIIFTDHKNVVITVPGSADHRGMLSLYICDQWTVC